MAKKTKKVEEVKVEEELVEQYGEEAAADIMEEKETAKKAEKPQVVSSKETICEFYWISDKELLSKTPDLSKYNLKKWEEEVLLERACKNALVKAWDIKFNRFTCSPEVREVIEKYGVSPKDVAEWKLDELNNNEKEIITDYYNELVAKL